MAGTVGSIKIEYDTTVYFPVLLLHFY